MNRPHPRTRTHNTKVELAFLAFALAAASCTLYVMAQGCDLLHGIAWVAFELARPLIIAALQSAPVHLCGAASVAQHLLHIVALGTPISVLASVIG